MVELDKDWLYEIELVVVDAAIFVDDRDVQPTSAPSPFTSFVVP